MKRANLLPARLILRIYLPARQRCDEERRHWFTKVVPHDTQDTIHVLNLIEGEQAALENPNGSFAPFVVNYAETFIVPAAVGPYTIRPCGQDKGREYATIEARVRASDAIDNF